MRTFIENGGGIALGNLLEFGGSAFFHGQESFEHKSV